MLFLSGMEGGRGRSQGGDLLCQEPRQSLGLGPRVGRLVRRVALSTADSKKVQLICPRGPGSPKSQLSKLKKKGQEANRGGIGHGCLALQGGRL